MAAKESPTAATKFELPEEVASVLPSDPFEQLDVARKITSIALSTRVSALEAESASLRAAASDKDRLIADLQSQLQSLTASLDVASAHLARAESDRETLLKENASLSSAVRRLNRDVYKLEAFRKTLMQSLREDDENSEGTAQLLTTQMSLSSAPASGEDDAPSPPSRSSTSLISLSRNSLAEDYVTDAPRPRISQELLFSSSVNDTPHFTPPGSPPKLSASVSPTKTSNPVSPRHHLTTGGMFEDRPSSYSSMPSSLHTSVSGSDTGSHTGRIRVDGKEFFRQVRSRLSYEQFGAFLANVKELNSRNQTREETLRKADEIFGSDHKDLYAVFEKLITRNVH